MQACFKYHVFIETNDPKVFINYIDDDGNFSFDRIIPMPKSLELPTGEIVDEAIAYYVTDRLQKTASETDLAAKLTGRPWDRDELAAEVISRLAEDNEENRSRNWDELYSLGEKYISNIECYRYPTMREWRRGHWGTDCDAQETRYDADNPCCLYFRAENFPHQIFASLCGRFRDVKIEITVRYAETESKWENQNGFLTMLETESEDEEEFEEDTEPLVMEKVDWVTHTYTVGNGFMVDIVECPDAQWGWKWCCYLYHDSYGTKMYMFGLPKCEHAPNLTSVEEIVLANLSEDNYIELFREEYMD